MTVIPPFSAPYLFSPNGDGNNDVWIVQNITQYYDYQVVIYNRWGNVMRRYKNDFEPWEGKNRQGQDVPDGVYFYVIQTSVNDEPIELSGYVTVAR